MKKCVKRRNCSDCKNRAKALGFLYGIEGEVARIMVDLATYSSDPHLLGGRCVAERAKDEDALMVLWESRNEYLNQLQKFQCE